MKTLLHQLENNEAILMMYLAGELPAEDEGEVDQWLAGDAGMRTELATLAALQLSVTQRLTRQDEANPLSGAAAAGRQFAGAVRRQHLINFAKPASPRTYATRRAWLAYPATAAAIILIGMGVWYKNADDPSGLPIPINSQLAMNDQSSDSLFAQSWESRPETDLVAQLLPDSAEAQMEDAIALRELNH